MKTKSSIVTLLVSLCLVFGLTMCKGGEQPQPEKKRSITLSTETITLSRAQKVSMVSVRSTDDWKSDLVIPIPKADVVLPPFVGQKKWVRITPVIGKAGITNVVVSLVEEKLLDESPTVTVKFESMDGTLSKTLTVKYDASK